MFEVVLALVFVMLLLSLFATTVMEALSSILALRGKNLEKAIRNMLAEGRRDNGFLDRFFSNPLYKQMTNRFAGRRPPSYLSDEMFRTILFQELLRGGELTTLREKVEELESPNLKRVLLQLLNDTEGDVDSFKSKVKTWYNDVMDRASGWYKRETGRLLVMVGFAIALIFNADSIGIFKTLQNDPEALQQVVQLATQFADTTDELDIGGQNQQNLEASVAKIQGMIDNEIENVSTPLGLGWDYARVFSWDFGDWVEKIVGWIITALAISLGAPFWFDLLKKLVSIRGSGGRPKETA